MTALTPFSATRPYVYKSVDRSVVCAWLMERLWRPSLRWVPVTTHPNTLTLLGNMCALAAFVVLMAVWSGASSLCLVSVALLLFLYQSLDNMDGAQARRTSQSSPLGEFFDHWGDGLNLGLTVLGYALMTKLPPTLIFACLASASFAYFSTMWEQRRTGCMHLGMIGVTEGMLGLCALYIAMAVSGRDSWLIARGPLGWSWTCWLALGACTGMVGTSALTIVRVGKGARDWLTLIGTALVVGTWWVCSAPPAAAVAIILIAMPSRFGGRQIIARLTGDEWPKSNVWLIAVFAAATVWTPLGGSAAVQTYFAWTAATYLTWSTVNDGFTTWRKLRI